MSRKILFIGGTKFIGAMLVTKFIESHDEVYIFSRSHAMSSAPVHFLQGDRDNASDLRNLGNWIQDIRFDCVYDMCCFNAEEASSLYQIIEGHARRLVFFSSAAVYARSGVFPLTEDAPLGVHDSFGDYGTGKAAAENIYKTACVKTETQLTIFRPHYILGNGDYFKRHDYFFDKIEKQRAIEVPGNGQALIQFAFAPDVVDLFYRVPFAQKQQDETLNISGKTLLSLNEVASRFIKTADKNNSIKNVDYAELGLREDRFYDNSFPFPNLNLILDSSRAIDVYGFKPRELDSYIDDLFADWQRQKNKSTV